MSKLNIFETNWIDLVFENRNKEYGAYHLRQENTKTSFFALFAGISLLTAAISIPMVYNYLNPEHKIPSVLPEIPHIVLVNMDPIVPDQTKPQEAVIPEIEKPVKETINTNKQLINPEIFHATAATQETIATNDELKNNPTTNVTGTEGSDLGTGTVATSGTTTNTPSISENAIIPSGALDKKPEFPGGIKKFYTYVGNNFEKPELDSESLIRVSVSFVVEKDGSMTDIKVLKDPGYGLGAEAIRVLKSLKTKWSPGIMDGKPVRTSYNLPITIQSN
ncbi:energy transducer TonB [Flavobacterium sp.]|uniref:energy transducer TonB n=1 Tax=Flavobacterium sp. TaxID=239 RepID=UPI002D004916|nr:energy transducer TonB [Flavobacterium sp.]HSD08246.1 energy transducer TonB [Flavobacterium sp.]